MFLNDQMLDSGALARRLLAPANNLVPVNLLTRQQASLEDAGTAGWVAQSNCTIARSTAQAASGSASLEVTSSAATYGVRTSIGTAGTRVRPSTLHTAVASVRLSAASRNCAIAILWYDAAGTYLSQLQSSGFVISNTGFTTIRISATAPSNAAYASIDFYFSLGASGDVAYVDQVGLWEGAGGSWVNGGERLDPSTLGWYWDESVGRRLFVWDTINSRWQMVYGDTGVRDITASATAPANATINNLMIRRVGSTVLVDGSATSTAATSGTIFTLPVGYRISGTSAGAWFGGANSATEQRCLLSTVSSELSYRVWDAGASLRYLAASWQTNEAWPTSLPGTASGTIPNL